MGPFPVSSPKKKDEDHQLSQTVTIPDGIKCSVKARTVTVTGPRGSLVKSFRHLKVDISKVDKKTLKVEKWFGLRKELAAVRTICSHITNMIVGSPRVTSTRCVLCMLISPLTAPSVRRTPCRGEELLGR